MDNFDREFFSVSDINRLSKSVIERNLPDSILVKGEISNVTYHVSGHLYFTVKDERSSLRAVCFGYKSRGVVEDLKHGDAIKLFGRLTIYESTGQYQMVCSYIEREDSRGKVYEEFLKIKKRLSDKGYFDDVHKKKIPASFCIGVVTSEKGAVIRDIISTAKSRFPNVSIYLYPAQVQGIGAEKEIIKGIKFFNTMDEIDSIIIGRGGGSFEDLNAFNSEELAEVIFKSSKPIVSAVGHETDFAISDFVADGRASTPTQAASMTVIDHTYVTKSLLSRVDFFNKYILDYAVKFKDRLEYSFKEINSAIQNRIDRNRYTLKSVLNSYIFSNLSEEVSGREIELANFVDRLKDRMHNILDSRRKEVPFRIDILKGLNPLNIISRGYSLTSKFGNRIYSVKEISEGDEIDTKLVDGNIKSVVVSKFS